MTDGQSDDGYGRGRRKRRKTLSLSQFFTDRQSESEAFMQSVWARDADLATDRVTPESLENVLLFHGFGGLGKTQLSLGLQSWIDPPVGAHSRAPSHWGAAPAPERPIVTARWDLNDSGGNLDPVTLLLSLRTALHTKRSRQLPSKTWRAFDVAFAAYAARVRPGQPLDPTDTTGGYASELPQMVGEVALETVVDVGAGVGMQGLLDAARGALGYIRQRRTLTEYPNLADLVEDCLTAEAGNVNAELASEILFQIDLAIHKLQPARRPLIVVFVDHLERIQAGTHPTRAGERLLNELVGALPHALFVMTGRNRLDWWKAERTGLEHAGLHKWPCLHPEIERRPHNPRPHLLETLSSDDARDWIERQSRELALPFAEGVVDNLIDVTGCWPVHIDAVFDLAHVKVRDGAEVLTVADLDGSFDDVVQRLLEDLPADEQTALQAACLLPYFDEDLIHTMTGDDVRHGTIERLVQRAVVLENYDSRYEYRVHDEVRRAVRAAGAHIPGGWTDADWRSCAQKALEYAVSTATAARKAKDDEANLAAVGLAITIAAEYGVSTPDRVHPDVDGVIEIRRKCPSNRLLLPLIPSSHTVADAGIRASVELIEIICRPADDESIARLAELGASGAASSTDALLWRAYRLRDLARHAEAAAQLEWLRDHGADRSVPERLRIYSRHVGVTYSMARRFADAAAVLPTLAPELAKANRLFDLSIHGHLTSEFLDHMRGRVERANARYSLELAGSLHRALARAGRLDRDAAREFLDRAVRFGNKTGQRATLTALALDDIANGLEFDLGGYGVISEVGSSVALGEMLAFKALRDGPDEAFDGWLTRAAARSWRGRSWIPVEMLVEHLGYALPPIDTQWLEPVDDVRRRWVGHYTALLNT